METVPRRAANDTDVGMAAVPADRNPMPSCDCFDVADASLMSPDHPELIWL